MKADTVDQAKKPRVALIHDWLTTMGGAEPTLLELHALFPDAPIYTSVYDREHMLAFADCDIRTTWMQRLLPKFVRYKHQLWPVLRAYAFRSFDLSGYDLIISSASAEAKAIRKHPDTTHVCYCHTPIRYYWSHYDEFKKEFTFGLLTWLIRPIIPLFVRWMRQKDLDSVDGVDQFIANSNETKRRIEQFYHRDSVVIFPPVDIERFAFKNATQSQRSGFIMWGRHVPYKRFDLAIAACNQLGAKLTIAGTGPDTSRLKQLAGPTVTFVGRVSDDELVHLAHTHQAFLFPGEEDFGISAVEALAAGLPVIAHQRGGALDIVTAKTGIFFADQTIDSLVTAIESFNQKTFTPAQCYTQAQQFSSKVFDQKIRTFIAEQSR